MCDDENPRDLGTADARVNHGYSVQLHAGTIGIERRRPDPKDTFVHVMLIWNSYSDLDLHVNGPDGHIYYGHKSGNGHFLMLDENVQATNLKPVEDHYFKTDTPDGVYTIEIKNYTLRNEPFTPFTTHFVTYKDSEIVETLSYDTTNDDGLRNKGSLIVGRIVKQGGISKVEVTPVGGSLQLAPPLPCCDAAPPPTVPLSIRTVTLHNADGYPDIAIYKNMTDARPMGMLRNSNTVSIMTENDLWCGFDGTFTGIHGRYYFKKRHIKPMTRPIAPIEVEERIG